MSDLTQEQFEWVRGLHTVARFFEDHPDLIPNAGQTLTDFTCVDDEKRRALAWARALESADKEYTDSLFRVWSKPGMFGPHKIGYVALREAVCIKRVTTVEREVTEPDPEAIAAVPTVTRTVTEEVVEWDCHPLLAEVAS